MKGARYPVAAGLGIMQKKDLRPTRDDRNVRLLVSLMHATRTNRDWSPFLNVEIERKLR